MQAIPITMVGLLGILLTACGSSTPQPVSGVSVIASIYPLEYFAARIGGEHVSVVNLVPPGVEAHAFEPTPRAMERIAAASVVVMNGLEMEPWLERALDALGNDFTGVVVEAADPQLAREADEHGDDADGDEHGLLDPHMWLDPVLARMQAQRVLDALVSAAPEHTAAFEANAAALDADLEALHGAFVAGLASCQHDAFVTTHAAYGYLAARYDLDQVEVAGLTPGVEPTPSRLAAVTDEMRQRGLATVLVEPLLRDLVAETLAAETGAEVRTIHPLASVTDEEAAEHGDYLGLMRDNLASLRMALDCAV